jgi:hypothetical protein
LILTAALTIAVIPAGICAVRFLDPSVSPQPVVDAVSDRAAEILTAAPPHAGSNSGLVLDDAEREYLWQIEHHGLVLARHGFGPLAEALSRGDQDAFRNLLAPDFIAVIPDDPREVRLDADFAHVLRREFVGRISNPSGTPDGLEIRPTKAGRPCASEFIARLMEYRRLFSSGKPPKVKLALMSLRPEKREDRNGLWQGTCQLRMWGETAGGMLSRPLGDLRASQQLGEPRKHAIHATQVSTGTDGGPGEVIVYLGFRIARPTEETLTKGKWLHGCSVNQSQIAHAPAPLMREVTAERGIDVRDFHDNWPTQSTKTTTGGVYLCDYDRDGILDMLITDVNRHALYKGLPGGKFRDVTTEVGLPLAFPDLPGMAIMAAFVDLDGDGWEDLILGDRIYRNEGGHRFIDCTGRTNLRLPRDAAGIAVADFDRDGRIDLYVARPGRDKADAWLEGKSGDPKGNQLWRNLGNWRFEDVTATSGTEGGHRSTGTAVWFDANNDGWPDLYVINEFGNGVLLLNQGDGTFREQLLVNGPGDFGSMGATCGDIDNDGNIDLYVANMYSKAGNRVIGNLKPGTYPADVMAKMRQFVTGSQLYRNLGAKAVRTAAGSGGTFQTCTTAQSPSRLTPSFEPLAAQYQVAGIGWAYGAALIDLDNDGWLDLYTTCGFISQSRTEPDG